MTADQAGTISGYIPSSPPPMILWLPVLEIRDEPSVVLHDEIGPPFVAVTLAGGLAIHVQTAGQARAMCAVFAKAAMLLEPVHEYVHMETPLPEPHSEVAHELGECDCPDEPDPPEPGAIFGADA